MKKKITYILEGGSRIGRELERSVCDGLVDVWEKTIRSPRRKLERTACHHASACSDIYLIRTSPDCMTKIIRFEERFRSAWMAWRSDVRSDGVLVGESLMVGRKATWSISGGLAQGYPR